MQPFVYDALPTRVVFGSGTLGRVAEEVRMLGCRRVMVLTGMEQRGRGNALLAQLGDAGAGLFAEAAMHTPVAVTERALAAVGEAGADGLVALGGGSAIGLGKAIALRTDLPQIAIPTTYAGSEATPVLGQTEGERKTTQRTRKVLPEVILYDVDLTLTLPAPMSATSGLNAIAHAVEALYAPDGNPVTASLAEQGIAALAQALPPIVADPGDREARSDALFGAWACGTCLGTVSMGLHHRLCHVLGGSFGLPHAATHAIILPHVAAFNAREARGAMARVARALGSPDAPGGLFDLAARLGVPSALRDIGMPEDGLDRAAALATEKPVPNPRPVTSRAIRDLLDDAWQGRRPGARR
ncbi:maleylacetate reductase [Roseomonas sp. OT10]|uniref:maleylacetate reductase n=1 Tax=Roseomonas cutis TaxID=2897332 RepID=UPI001E397B6B|nr:maleylacetate reductase [Roseomonas sp. OT10]UFN48469.1 maleylacetate reductase [Roseomonas sp. OT10]